MEVVEVSDFQCHSDGEEVVLLDLDKTTNGVQDSPEVHEVTMEEANGESQDCPVNGEGTTTKDGAELSKNDSVDSENKDDSANGIDVIEMYDGVSNDIKIEMSEIIELVQDSESMCDNNTTLAVDVSQTTNDVSQTTNDISQTTDMDESVDDVVMTEESNGCSQAVNDQQDEVDGSATKLSDTGNAGEINSNTNDGIETEMENVEGNDDSIDKSVEKEESSTTEIRNPDGSIVLKKDKVTVTIPQHIAGRDISSLTEETIQRSGKLMLKPRYGVKVPYIHMTSQIVTQDEIAKELFERFQQKYPMTRADKPDKLFSMKLTHRLANKTSPLKNDGKSKDASKTTDKSQKQSSSAKKELLNKKSEKTETNSSESNTNKIQSPDTQLANNVFIDSLQVDSPQIDQITNTLQSLDQSSDQHMNNVSEEKNDEKITSNEELIAILEDFENIETAETNGDTVPPEIQPSKPLINRKIVRSATTRTKRSKPKLDPELEKQIALKQLQEVSRPKRYDSNYTKRKAENDKKQLNKSDLSGSAQKRKKPASDDVPEVKIAIDHYIKSYTDKRQSTVKLDQTSNDDNNIEEVQPLTNDNIEEVQPITKTIDTAKARTMREINRLLGDEGAINMIYSLEKRRVPGNNNSKNILPSTRRKKKDLMLKTKLVKNAMLKMSSPTNSPLSANRLGRRSDVCTPSPENKSSRKTSIDSQDSDHSVKCLGNFSGRKTIPADESKIIRKHSSSSEASSVCGSPILPIPDAVPINNLTPKHNPVKPLRVYTRKNKNSDDLLSLSDQSVNEVSKETNKSIVKTKNPVGLKGKKQPVQVSSKMSRSSTASIEHDVENTSYNEITVRRYDGVVHITLTPVSTAMKNALNISVMEELMNELCNLENDDTCKVVLISSAGRIFCQGLDVAPLVHDDPVKCKEAAVEIASTLKKFILCLDNFSKLLVAGVDGAAVGLGATMLVHFDLVFASDKATFETHYGKLGHIAEGAATTILTRLLFAEMILGSQRLTAGQAHYHGLVTRTLWPDRFHDELIPLVKALARQSLQAMVTSKALQKQETKDKLAKALESETHILVQQWISDECQHNFQTYLKDAVVNINT